MNSYLPNIYIPPIDSQKVVVYRVAYIEKFGEFGSVRAYIYLSMVRKLHDKGIKPNSERLRFYWPMLRDTNGLASRDMLEHIYEVYGHPEEEGRGGRALRLEGFKSCCIQRETEVRLLNSIFPLTLF